jgi:hypothetical protein
MDLVSLCNHVWSQITPDAAERVDGGQLRPIMLMSGLDMAVLAEIWGLVDTRECGSVDYREFGTLMGLMSLAQRGAVLDSVAVGPATPSPRLEGLAAPSS